MTILLFDMMDTLIDDPFFRAVPQLMNEEELRRWAAVRNPQTFLDFEAGLIGEARYFRDFFHVGADIAGLPAPQKMKKEMFREVRWLPNIFELLRRIKHPMGLASNYSLWYRHVFQKRKELPSLFQYHFFSCEIGVRKPHRRFYEALHNSLAAESILFFDDRAENLKAAAELGWQTVHIEKDRAAQIIEEALLHRGLL